MKYTQVTITRRIVTSVILALMMLVVPLLCYARLRVNTDVIRRTVVFIYAANEDGSVASSHPIGTGFLVAIPKKGDATGSQYLFLVTARHIVDPDWVSCGPDPERLYLRFNTATYDPNKDSTGVEYLPLDLRSKNQPAFWVSDDDQVDAAIVLLRVSAVPPSKYDYVAAKFSDFATTEELHSLGVGDAILSAGLVPDASGEKRNYPIFKFGHISSIPNEPVWVSGCSRMPALRQERVWLIAMNLVGGNSGSPIVYVPPGTPGVAFGTDVMRPVLVGIQSMSIGGADIAGMTPVEDVVRIFEKTKMQLDLYRGDTAPESGPKTVIR